LTWKFSTIAAQLRRKPWLGGLITAIRLTVGTTITAFLISFGLAGDDPLIFARFLIVKVTPVDASPPVNGPFSIIANYYSKCSITQRLT
jgi:hypothetical protein